jgi:hypothetical protein
MVKFGKKVKVLCSCCDGKKFIEETSYIDRKPIKIKCPACRGQGYYWEDLFMEAS